MPVAGVWDVTIKTPVGSLPVVYTFTDDGGMIAGTATGKGVRVPLRDITVAAKGVRAAFHRRRRRP